MKLPDFLVDPFDGDEFFHETEGGRTHVIFKKGLFEEFPPKCSSKSEFFGPFKSGQDAKNHALRIHHINASFSKQAIKDLQSIPIPE